MIRYQTYNEIRFLREHEGVSCEGIARRLHLDARTVSKWARREAYGPRKASPRPSILDPYKPAIRRDWELGESSGTAIFKSLRQAGYTGGCSILRSYLHSIRRVQTHTKYEAVLPLEWMLRLLQGKVTGRLLAPELGASMSPDDVATLIRRIRSGPLRVRNRAVTVLASFKGISLEAIARFLMIDPRMVGRYVHNYARRGLDGLFAFHEGREKKREQPLYKDAVFALLHSPPKVHGVNRTSWCIPDLKRVLRQQGLVISRDNIGRIIRDAGFRFRSAKRVLTSTDPQYQEKLAEITRILSGLTETQKFFPIDEFGPFAVKIQGGRALTAPGERRTVPQWQKSKGRLTLVGALELATNQMTHFYADRKSTAEMIRLMHILLLKYRDQSVLYLSWDAASWHASKAFVEEVAHVNGEQYRALNNTPTVTLVPLPACAQFLNVIESVFSGMARAIIHNSNYDSVENCMAAIDRYYAERNQSFQEHPRRAGNKLWGKERVPPVFSPSNNCKDPRFC